MKNLQSIFIFLCFIIYLTPISVYAAPIEAIIVWQNQTLHLRVEGYPQSLLLQRTPSAVKEQLLHLQTGDKIMGDGEILWPQKTINLNSISSVGLKSLLGFWKTNSWDIFEFENFQVLNLYLSKNLLDQSRYRYSLSPTKQGTYSILLVNQSSIDIGRLTLEEDQKQLRIEIIDQETGQAERIMTLSPLNWSTRSL